MVLIKVLHEVKKEPTFADIIEYGTPGRKGVIRVHGDFNNPEDFQRRIDNAFVLRRYVEQKDSIE